jgi:hypothetical protein
MKNNFGPKINLWPIVKILNQPLRAKNIQNLSENLIENRWFIFCEILEKFPLWADFCKSDLKII